MVDKLLIKKQALQKDMIKFVNLQVEHQMLRSEKNSVERQLGVPNHSYDETH